MEEEKITIPYYETAYIDDNNIKHLAYVKNKVDIGFLYDRFTVLECRLITYRGVDLK